MDEEGTTLGIYERGLIISPQDILNLVDEIFEYIPNEKIIKSNINVKTKENEKVLTFNSKEKTLKMVLEEHPIESIVIMLISNDEYNSAIYINITSNMFSVVTTSINQNWAISTNSEINKLVDTFERQDNKFPSENSYRTYYPFFISLIFGIPLAMCSSYIINLFLNSILILNIILIYVSAFAILTLLFFYLHQNFYKRYKNFIKEYSPIIFKNNLTTTVKKYRVNIDWLKDIGIPFVINIVSWILTSVIQLMVK